MSDKKTGSSNGSAVKSGDRTKSREAMKKMGGGKKGLWGKPQDVLTVPAVDTGDPNFDSEGEDNVVLVANAPPIPTGLYRDVDFDYGPPAKMNLPEFKVAITNILLEYFVGGDMDEVQRSLLELDSEVFHYEVVKRGIAMSMEKHEKEREMFSRLVSELYPKVLTTKQVGKGFERLFETIDDLSLDSPNARSMLITFLARAVVDEVLPPSFLMDPLVMQLGGSIVDNAKKKLSINHATARLEKGWGPGDGRPVDELKVAIDQLVQEYLLSGDKTEATNCVRELHVPHFHHEVVKRAITNAVGTTEEQCVSMSALFDHLIQDDVLTTDQLRHGMGRVQQSLPDLTLDVPGAPTFVSGFVQRAESAGYLQPPTSTTD